MTFIARIAVPHTDAAALQPLSSPRILCCAGRGGSATVVIAGTTVTYLHPRTDLLYFTPKSSTVLGFILTQRTTRCGGAV